MSDGQAQARYQVTHNVAQRRYETQVEGQLAVLTYEREGERIIYLHTGVPRPIEGRGVGTALAHAALEDARAQRLQIVPLCPFIGVYLRRHPEYRALLAESQETRFQ